MEARLRRHLLRTRGKWQSSFAIQPPSDSTSCGEQKRQTRIFSKICRKQAFARIFAKFSRDFRRVFATFLKFSQVFEVFGLAPTCPDLFGCVRMRSDASGCVRMHLDTCGKIQKNRPKNLVFRNLNFSQFSWSFWGATQKRTSPATSSQVFALDTLIWTSVRTLELHI